MTIRMLATSSAAQFATSGLVSAPSPPIPAGRAYSATAGVPIDVAGDMAGDVAALANQGFIALGTSGQTSARPLNPKPGAWHVDTTLGYAVIFDGSVWRNPVSGAAV